METRQFQRSSGTRDARVAELEQAPVPCDHSRWRRLEQENENLLDAVHEWKQENERLETAVVDRVLLLDRAKRAETENERLQAEHEDLRAHIAAVAEENERLQERLDLRTGAAVKAEIGRLRDERLQADVSTVQEVGRLKDEVERLRAELANTMSPFAASRLVEENERLREKPCR